MTNTRQEQNKYDEEAASFTENFAKYKDLKIIIYGIGRRTLTLLPRINGFNIVGLLDRDPKNIGKKIIGVSVLSLEEACRVADIVIINSDPSNYSTIYRRIYSFGFEVFYGNGKQANESDLITEIVNDPMIWSKSYKELIKEIDGHSVISFDVFDTLLERTLVNPSDLFELMNQKHKTITRNFTDFKQIRMLAPSQCPEKEPSLEEIYRQVNKGNKLTDIQIRDLFLEEVESEKMVIRPRQQMIDALRHAIDNGKKVYIISDMYLSGTILKGIIEKYANVELSQDSVWVSCELNMNKKESNLWNTLIAKNGTDLIHIGDDEEADCKVPSQKGIDSFRVQSAISIMANSCFREALAYSVSIGDRVACGLVKCKLFGDPFVERGDHNRIILDADKLGYCLFGPLLLSYFCWMLESTAGAGFRRIIFLARDGYFPFEDYLFFKELATVNNCTSFPDALYLHISRRIVLVSALPDGEAWEELLRIPFQGTYSEYLYSRFNVHTDDRTCNLNDEMWDGASVKKAEALITPYINEINEELLKEKENYIDYLNENGLFKKDYSEVLMDLGCQGTNQYFLQKIIHKKMQGRYFYANRSNNNPYLKECDIQACFQHKDDLNGDKSQIRKQSAYIESFFTAPYGMIRYLDSNDGMVCEESKTNQTQFDTKIKINESAKKFISDACNLIDVLNNPIGIDFVNAMYSAVWSGGCEIEKNTAKSFYFDNDLIGSDEVNLIES